MMQSFSDVQALIGAFQSQDRRYIEYVDGSIMTDGGWFNQSYAVLNNKVCTCGTRLMFDPNIQESETGIKRPLSSCINSASYSKLGNDAANGKFVLNQIFHYILFATQTLIML